MPRARAIPLTDHPSYKEYVLGQSGKRWPKLGPWEFTDNGEVKIPLGEVFCRVPRGTNGDLCPCDRPYSTHSNLKQHVKGAHKLKIVAIHRGASSIEEREDIRAYYTRLIPYLRGETAKPVEAVAKAATASSSRKRKAEQQPGEDIGIEMRPVVKIKQE